MRREPKKKPKTGDVRVVERFLFEPKRLMLKSNTDYVMTRWLERATIEQVYRNKRWVDRYWSNH